jgi:predicted glycoside hydrolase/deacetylase ChbG (UPF0249 family)
MPLERRLIVNADDFGLSPGVNRGVVDAHDNGIVTSASLMVHMPAAPEAALLARDCKGLSLGLHIDIGEWKYEHGQWVSLYERVCQDDPRALKEAVLEQLDRFRKLTGTDPTHLDSHQHVHRQGPLRPIVCDLADRLGIPLRHFTPRILYCGAFYGQDEQGRSLPGRLTTSFLIEIIEGLRSGVTELGCHPAANLDFQGTYYRERLLELEVLCSPAVIEALGRERVLLRSFDAERASIGPRLR